MWQNYWLCLIYSLVREGSYTCIQLNSSQRPALSAHTRRVTRHLGNRSAQGNFTELNMYTYRRFDLTEYFWSFCRFPMISVDFKAFPFTIRCECNQLTCKAESVTVQSFQNVTNGRICIFTSPVGGLTATLCTYV